MEKLRPLFLLLTTLLLSQTLFAQAVQVRGKVLDKDGQPVAGVSIIEKGTNNGTTTDGKGAYAIRVRTGDATLVFSCLGYASREEGVGRRTTVDMVLQEEARSLETVVVDLGYTTSSRADLTGSVSSIGKEALGERVLISLEDAMRGKAAGLQIVQNDGSPGSDYTMRIRGASSVNAGSAPIYVVDGVIMDDAYSISPGDVESIDILKDASATALYGSRGANGVIVVTTRQGRTERPNVEFYTNIGIQEPARLYDMMDSPEYALMRYQATGWKYYKYGTPQTTLDGAFSGGGTVYRDSPYGDANYWVLQNTNSFREWRNYADSTDTDWQDVMMRSAVVQEYRLSVSGKKGDTRYSLSGGFLSQDGIVVNSGFERYTGRINIEQNLSKRVKLSSNISGSRSKYTGLATGSMDGIISQLLRQPPTKSYQQDYIYDDITENETTQTSNPYRQVMDITRDRYRQSLTARLVLDWYLTPKITMRGTGTWVNNQNKDKSFFPYNTNQGFKTNGRAVQNRVDNDKLMGEAFVYYKNVWCKVHRLSVMAGATVEKFRNESLTAESYDFPKKNLAMDAMQLGIKSVIPVTDIVEWRMASFLGSAEYSFKSRYILKATLRADGSSRFGEGNKWAYFPSASAAWHIGEEKAVKDLGVFDMLKLRGGYGRSGNTAIPSYRSLSLMGNANHPMDGTGTSLGMIIDRASNPDLKWEVTDMLDIAMDMAFLNNRLRATVGVYNKVTSDLLLEKNTPLTSGYEKVWSNIGSIRNQGLEVTLGATLVNARDWRWNVDMNIGFNRSKVLDIGPRGELGFDPGVIPGSGNFVMIQQGRSLGQWYGYEMAGVYKSQYEIDDHGMTEVLGSSTSTTPVRPGDYKFVDQNGDDKINSEDLTVLGRGEPLYTGGVSTSFGYRNFDMAIGLQYSYGAKVFNANLVYLDAGREGYNQTSHVRECWAPTLYDASGAVFFAGNDGGKYRIPGGGPINYCTSKQIEDGSFLRVSDIRLTYTFGRKVLSKMHLHGLQLFASANNLWVFSTYSGYDPEVNTRQGQTGDLMPSLDYSAYPRSKSFSGGVRINF